MKHTDKWWFLDGEWRFLDRNKVLSMIEDMETKTELVFGLVFGFKSQETPRLFNNCKVVYECKNFKDLLLALRSNGSISHPIGFDDALIRFFSDVLVISGNSSCKFTGPGRVYADESQVLTTSDSNDGMTWKELESLMNDKIPLACPETGEFIAYKCAYYRPMLGAPEFEHRTPTPDFSEPGYLHVSDALYQTILKLRELRSAKEMCIIKLHIPDTAKRSSSISLKCRCNKALVTRMYAINALNAGDNVDEIKIHEVYDHVYSMYNPSNSMHNPWESMLDKAKLTEYKYGEMVYPDSFDDDRWHECSHGIHFFTTMEAAVGYALVNAPGYLPNLITPSWNSAIVSKIEEYEKERDQMRKTLQSTIVSKLKNTKEDDGGL